MKEAAAALGVGAPLLQANPVHPAQTKKTNPAKFKELKAHAAIGGAPKLGQTVTVRRNMEDNLKNKSSNKVVFGKTQIVKTRAIQEKISVHNELQSRCMKILPAKETNQATLGKKMNKTFPDPSTSSSAALLKSQQAVVSVMKTTQMPGKRMVGVKEEPGLVGNKSTLGRKMGAIPGINKSAIYDRITKRIISRSKSAKLPQGKLVVKQEKPEIGGQGLEKSSRKRVFNSRKHQSLGNNKRPNFAQKPKTASKSVAKNAVKVNGIKKLAVKVEKSSEEKPGDDDEEEVAIEYEEREESACPYCMKQFTCWEKVTAHMGKVHANE